MEDGAVLFPQFLRTLELGFSNRVLLLADFSASSVYEDQENGSKGPFVRECHRTLPPSGRYFPVAGRAPLPEALLNPARLASAERGYADFGSWSGGEAQARALSAGIGFGRRFYLGLFASTSGGTFANTNAVIIQNRFGAQLAYRIPLDADGRGSFSIGIGEANFLDQPLPGWSAAAVRWYLPRMGVRFRPAPFASVALERLWNRYWAAGATLGTGSWLPVRCEADFRMANGPFLQYRLPDEAGWSIAWNLRILW